jgi:predicted dehydrogenase
MCEKPMATSVSDAEKMIDTSKRTGKTLGIILQNRYNQASKFIKNAIDDGILGNVLGARASVCWYRNDEYYSESGWRGSLEKEGGSVCANQAIHTLDLMLWFVGKRVAKVDSSTATLIHNIETEDEASGVITFDDGVRANFFFTVNHFMDKPVEIEISGENGVAKLVGREAQIILKSGEVLVPEEEKTAAIEYGNMKVYWGYAHVKQISNFYRHLINKEPLFVDYNDALRTQKIVCAILEAGKTKKSIEF